MPVSLLSDKELDQLLTAIVNTGGADILETLLGNCHCSQFETYVPLMPYEPYFYKELAYRDFDLHIPKFVVRDSSVQEADIQFKRPSKFPSPYFNRNRSLIKKLRSMLSCMYEGEKIHEERDDQVRRIYYKATQSHISFKNMLEWTGECILIDEPHSSGQTDEDLTDIRNDFVIILFNRVLALPKRYKSEISSITKYRLSGNIVPAMNESYQKNRKSNGLSAADWIEKGGDEFILNRYEAAKSAFDNATMLEPENPLAYYRRAAVYNKLGDKKKAFNDLKFAARLGHEKSREFLKSKGIDW
ncbi:tetratricopeptide repeat protein [Thermodesulfobacteriota bacterium]